MCPSDILYSQPMRAKNTYGEWKVIVNKPSIAMKLWRNEVTRVMADRFVCDADKEWFDNELLSLVSKELGVEYRDMIKEPKYTVTDKQQQ